MKNYQSIYQSFIVVSEGCHDEQRLGPYVSLQAAHEAGKAICKGAEGRAYQAYQKRVEKPRMRRRTT